MLVARLSEANRIFATVSGNNTYGLEKYGEIHTGIDAENEAGLEKIIGKTNPDFILNCIGVIKQIADEKDAEKILRINAILPHWLAKMAKAKLIHFSTDCVFSGQKGPYSETDRPDIPASDIYGSSKLWGEVDYGNALTLRTSFIGPELKGKHSLFEWVLANKGRTVEGYKNVLYSGVTTLEMAKIIQILIENFPDLSGLWHVSGEEISKYSLIKLIDKIFDLNITVKENLRVKCDRRLDSGAFQGKTGYRPKSWETMLRELKDYIG
jgi:dTDP-4-dehydrorhamnose reductase